MGFPPQGPSALDLLKRPGQSNSQGKPEPSHDTNLPNNRGHLVYPVLRGSFRFRMPAHKHDV